MLCIGVHDKNKTQQSIKYWFFYARSGLWVILVWWLHWIVNILSFELKKLQMGQMILTTKLLSSC